MSEKLNESFEKLNKDFEKRKNLEIEKEVMENTLKENKELQRYIKILKDIEAINKKEEEAKKTFYEMMMEEELDALNGKACDITLKKPYTRKDFDLKTLLADYAANPGDKKLKYAVDTYVYEKVIKGNVSIKIIPDT